jgi:hypothetical protein
MDDTVQVRVLDDVLADRTLEVAMGEDGGPPLTFEFDYVPSGTNQRVFVEYEIVGTDDWDMPEYRATRQRTPS